MTEAKNMMTVKRSVLFAVLSLLFINAYAADYLVDFSKQAAPFANFTEQAAKEVTQNINGIDWTLKTRKCAKNTGNAGYLQIATQTVADKTVTLKLSGFNANIESVEIYCWRTQDQASVSSPTVSVSVDGDECGAKEILNARTPLTFSCGKQADAVLFTFTQADEKKPYGLYIGSVKVVYSTAPTISMDENGDNASLLQQHENGELVNLSLNRSFKNDGWYTLCLPFDLDKSKVESTFGKGTEVEEFASVTINDDGLAELTFAAAEDGIKAGVPYLLKPTQASVANPTFAEVTILCAAPSVVEKDGYQFVGTFSQTPLSASGTNRVLGGNDGSSICPVGVDGALKGSRCYFVFPSSAQMTSQNVVFNRPTGIEPIISAQDGPAAKGLYTLQGVRVPSDRNVPAGIYIRNGKKILIKNF